MNSPPLKLFTNPLLLYRLGRSPLTRLLNRFTDLLPNKYALPNPSPDNDSYFDSLAQTLECPAQLPDALLQALHDIEASTAPENHPDIQSTPNTDPDDARSALLESAIQLWLNSHPAIESAPPPALPAPNSTLPTPQSAVPTPDSALRTPHSQTSDGAAFLHLAGLSVTEYDRVRRPEAKRLHLRLSTLDAQVAQCRSQINDDAQANAVRLPVTKPWPEPVLDAPALLDQVAARFTNYVVLPPGAAGAIALWGAHSHAFRAFHQTPRLNLYSPKRGCGKTTALDVLATLVSRPFRTENMRAAVLFRVVDQQSPTLLLDEVDTYLHQANELRGLLNAGHKRGACAYRCEGAGNAIRSFNAFAPAALAGIGALPPTLHDRSILIPLVPAQPGQITARFDEHHTDLEQTLASKLARWAIDNFDALAASDPILPPTAFNRLADNWRPLFAVAQVVGGDWPRHAADAFAKLTSNPPSGYQLLVARKLDGGASTLDYPLLLADIRGIFAHSGTDRLFSKDLVQSLNALDHQPSTFSHQLSEARLARQLSPLGIRPKLFRIGRRRGKGYDLSDFPSAA